jgi:WD40 repeat protein
MLVNQEVRYCSDCGAPQPKAGAKFCLKCGAALGAPAATAPVPAQPPARRFALWIIPVLLLVVSAILLALISLKATRTGLPALVVQSPTVPTAPTVQSTLRAAGSGMVAEAPTVKATEDSSERTALITDLRPSPTATLSPRTPRDPRLADTLDLAAFAEGELRRFGRGRFEGVALSPAGDLVAVATGQGVWLYRVDDETDAGRLLTDGAVAQAVAWSPDGTRLAALTSRGSVILWDAETASIERQFGHCGIMGQELAWAPDGSRLAAHCGRNVALFDPETGTELQAYEVSDSNLHLVWSPDGRRLAISFGIWGAGDPRPKDSLRIWNVETGQVEQMLQAPDSHIAFTDVAWSPDGREVAAAFQGVNVTQTGPGSTMTTFSDEGTLRYWDPATGGKIFDLPTSLFAGDIAFSPDGRYLAAGVGGGVKLMDPATGSTTRLLVAAEDSEATKSLSWSADGQRLAMGSMMGSVAVWSADSGQTLRVLPGHFWPGDDVFWSPDGRRIATTSLDGRLHMWELSSGRALEKPDFDDVDQLSPDWKRVLTRSGAPGFEVRSIETGELAAPLVSGMTFMGGVTWSPESSRLAISGADKIIRIYDVADGVQTSSFRGPETGINALEWSPDGALLASAGWDGIVGVRNIASGANLSSLRAAKMGDGVVGLSWFADNRRLAVATGDEQVQIWDALTGTRQVAFPGLLSPGELVGIAVSPDGNLLATTDAVGAIHLLDAQTGEGQAVWSRGSSQGPGLVT